MLSKFLQLDSEKRQRIIDAALEEFAHKGYKNASTNEIVQKANIAKGLLFHYFASKQSLFQYLVDYSWDIFITDFYNRVDYAETDFMRRWQKVIELKIELTQRHPDLYDFVMTAVADTSPEAKDTLESKIKNSTEDGLERMLRGIDTSRFRDDVNVPRVIQMVMWVAQGISNREIEKLKSDPEYRTTYDIHAVMAEVSEYMNLLTTAFYK